MSSERLKKAAERFALGTKIAYIITVIAIFLQTVSLIWLTIMPNKFIKFFDSVRIYEPFITNIKNSALSLFELSTGIVAFLFLFVILRCLEKILLSLKEELNLFKVGANIKTLSLYFLSEAIAVPILKVITYSIFVKETVPAGILDVSALVMAGVLWYIGQVLQTKSVEKNPLK
ncbi:MAG: hypothetical protein IJ323_05750 [Clostridia bacterium]|nr:hypothetical protein [Clostridia bacterium]